MEQNVILKITPAVTKFISEKSFDPAQGARFVRRNIQQLLEDPLAEKIVSGRTQEGARISADVKGDKIAFSMQRPEKLAVLV